VLLGLGTSVFKSSVELWLQLLVRDGASILFEVSESEGDGAAEGRSIVRDALEMGVYLSIVLIALIVSFESSLDDGGEVLLIWGSAVGLSLAHVFAFRLAHVFEFGIPVAEGWWSVGGMFLTAFGVALLASVPYVVSVGSVSSAALSTWLLMGVVAVVGYLAAWSRDWSMIGRLAYTFVILLMAASISIVKYFLTH